MLLNRDLLHGPRGTIALNQDVVRDGVHLVNQAAALAVSQAGLGPAEQFSAVIQAIELARAVAAVEILRSNLNAPGRANAAIAGLEVQVGVIDLDSEVAAVAHVDVAVFVRGDAVRSAELVLAIAVRADGLLPGAVFRDFDDARVAVAVAYEHVVVLIPGDVGFAVERAHVAGGIAFS